MSDIRRLLEKITAIESGTTPVAVKSGLNPQQKSADQLPALFRPHKITALGAKTDPQHPMKGMAVGASESQEPRNALEEAMAEIEEDMLGKIRQDLNDYLRGLEDRVSDDGRRDKDTPSLDKLAKKERQDRDLIDKAKTAVNQGQVEENAQELNIGDEVIVTGPVQYNGATGVIDDFGRDKRFVVVNLYNYGRHSFHSSDVEFNDYADSDEEHDDWLEKNPDDWFDNDPDANPDMNEDPTQQDMTIQPPPVPIENPSLPENTCVESIPMEDGIMMEIHGDDESGYEVCRGGNKLKTRFPNLDHARMAVDLYRAHRRSRDQDQDYIEER